MTRGRETASQISVRFDGVCDQTPADCGAGRFADGMMASKRDVIEAGTGAEVGVTERLVGDGVGSGNSLG